MIKIEFPDGSVREFAKGTTGMQIAEGISPRLAKEVLSISVNDITWDLMRPIEEDAKIKNYFIHLNSRLGGHIYMVT